MIVWIGIIGGGMVAATAAGLILCRISSLSERDLPKRRTQ